MDLSIFGQLDKECKKAPISDIAHRNTEPVTNAYHIPSPEPAYNCKCGLRQPFCACENTQPPNVVKCSQCSNFKPDELGGGGIGTCLLGIEFTDKAGRRYPLYPYARRYCTKFNQTSI